MQRLYRGEAVGIICWKLDRLTRNPVDGGSIIWAIKQHGIRVMTSAQSYPSRLRYRDCCGFHRSQNHFAFPVRIAVALVPIILPLKWLQIGQLVCASRSNRLDMINLPAPFLRLTIAAALNTRATGIPAETDITGIRFPLSPYSINCCLIERLSIRVCVPISRHLLSLSGQMCLCVVRCCGLLQDFLQKCFKHQLRSSSNHILHTYEFHQIFQKPR
jgi:hypothetical protein